MPSKAEHLKFASIFKTMFFKEKFRSEGNCCLNIDTKFLLTHFEWHRLFEVLYNALQPNPLAGSRQRRSGNTGPRVRVPTKGNRPGELWELYPWGGGLPRETFRGGLTGSGVRKKNSLRRPVGVAFVQPSHPESSERLKPA